MLCICLGNKTSNPFVLSCKQWESGQQNYEDNGYKQLCYYNRALLNLYILQYRTLVCTFFYVDCDRHKVNFLANVQGAGAFEVAARQHLMNEVKKTVQGVI